MPHLSGIAKRKLREMLETRMVIDIEVKSKHTKEGAGREERQKWRERRKK